MAWSAFAQTTLQSVSDAAGASSDFLAALWNRSDAGTIRFVQVGLYPTSAAGSYSTTGRNISAGDPGIPLPSGGCYIYITNLQDLRNFRIQADSGGTITLVGVAYR